MNIQSASIGSPSSLYSLLRSKFFIASILLVGCGSGGYQVAPTGSTLQRAVPLGLNTNAVSAKPDTSPLRGEVLSASNVKVKKNRVTFGSTFTASGAAKGPYPGAFVAKGSWARSFITEIWSFSESFKITSGARKISGTIAGRGSLFGGPPMTDTTFGPVAKRGTLLYHSRIGGIHYFGPVTTNEIQAGSLGEMLRR